MKATIDDQYTAYNFLTVDDIKAIAEDSGGEIATKIYYKLAEQAVGLKDGDIANIKADNDEGKAVLYEQVATVLGIDAETVKDAANDSNHSWHVQALAALKVAKGKVEEGIAEAENKALRGHRICQGGFSQIRPTGGG